MSYRTKVNGVQVFGNNECHPEWIEFISSQGIVIDNEYHYKGEIKDFMGALNTIEKITLRLIKEKGSSIKGAYDMLNFSYIVNENDIKDKYSMSIFDKLIDIIKSGYAFMPYQFYTACKDCLEHDHVFSTEGHFECYKLREGERIMVEAN